ncbi:MAG: hypothetical protein JRI36_01420 [Deltaproteobacteria bacterium]|nr:hypothetical protein [Deltaproteobacteria bacterium]
MLKPLKQLNTRHLVVLLVLWTACVYANSLNAPFYLDDEVNILENPFIRLTDISLDTVSQAAFNSPCPNRPVANVTFGLNYWLKGYNPAAYRIVNIVFHVITGILLYLFVETTIRISREKGRYGSAQGLAFLTALIWLVHPLQTETVTYIVQRMNIMTAMFTMAAWLCYLRGRLASTRPAAWAWFSGMIPAWGLALGCKEIAVALPGMILLYEWIILRNAPEVRTRAPFWMLATTVAVAGVAVLIYTDFSPLRAILSGYNHRDFTAIERLLTQSRVILYYISLMIYPHPSRLNLVHEMTVSHSLFDPPTTLIATGAIFAAVFWAVR